MEYLALGDGSPDFPQSGMFRGTQVSRNREGTSFPYGAVTRYGRLFHGVPVLVSLRRRRQDLRSRPFNPVGATPCAWHAYGLGYSLFAHHYLGNHCYFLFLELLRCFSSLRSPSAPMNSGRNDPLLTDRVSPFGHLRILGCLLLPEDYRRLTASFIGSDDQGIHHVPLLFSSMTYKSFLFYVFQRNVLFV